MDALVEYAAELTIALDYQYVVQATPFGTLLSPRRDLRLRL
ncbi:MAG: hypothetical protein ACLR5G_00030 [Eubacteriales bacterium]